MILYFTGTGNSKFVADALADLLEDEVVSLNVILKSGAPLIFESSKPFIVVAPIYAWGLPKVVNEMIRNATFKGAKSIYFVPTMGGNSGTTHKRCYALAQQCGLEFRGFRGVIMPPNYIVLFNLPTEERIVEILKSALVSVKEIAKIIKDNDFLLKQDHTFLSHLKSGAINSGFGRYMQSSRSFKISESCTGCGICAENCATNNIEIKDGRPTFADKCINCFSCVHRCPQKAINVNAKTEQRGRYVCPEYRDFIKNH